ncbi:hypothetical protein FQN57_001392 [Myotisia sp. PD_48]|nr:hypothetical protein FQN57_001392 [Myotisia sp. PD_48]
MGDGSRVSVAIIGSGMAGLVMAYLLQQDPDQRFDVQVFESQEKLSLDSASITLTSDDGAHRIDQPMRGFDEGFYPNLKRMYSHLGIPYDSKKFLFSFSRRQSDSDDPISFIHSSNNHRFPPVWPHGSNLGMWIGEVIYLAICFAWFSLCCFFIPPREATGTTGTNDVSSLCESFDEYRRRVYIPQYFVENYLLPPLSSMSTCSHREMLDFPASDIISYIQRTFNAPHYLVRSGIREVERKLSPGLNISLGCRVTSVRRSDSSSVLVSWDSTSEELVDTEKVSTGSYQKSFDHVILAVPPSVVGYIFHPLTYETSLIPTTSVEAVIHTDTSTIPASVQAAASSSMQKDSKYQTLSNSETEWMHLRSTSEHTESVHEHPASFIITNHPITPIDPAKIIHRARFTRTLRTPQSRAIVNRIFDVAAGSESQNVSEKISSSSSPWHNGDGNVWLVGSWCWDGMTLLEGCLVSAMRVADEFGVQTPWAV